MSRIKVVIRPMKLTDIGQCDKINCALLTENYGRDFWLQIFGEGKAHCYVAVAAGFIVGYVLCRKGGVISFAVLEEYQGYGIGTRLMQFALNSHVGTELYLNARVSNIRAVKLYESLGYTITKTVPGYYCDPPEDAYEMMALPVPIDNLSSKMIIYRN